MAIQLKFKFANGDQPRLRIFDTSNPTENILEISKDTIENNDDDATTKAMLWDRATRILTFYDITGNECIIINAADGRLQIKNVVGTEIDLNLADITASKTVSLRDTAVCKDGVAATLKVLRSD